MVDLQNIKYLNMNKEKRQKNLATIAKRIAEFVYDDEHSVIKKIVAKEAKLRGCCEGKIRLMGFEYPEEILW